MPDCSHFPLIGWSAKTLERFLANPLKAVPGTAMGYAGVTDRHDITALARAGAWQFQQEFT
jgi:cytochrome c2